MIAFHSYLKGLIPSFNSIMDDFLENLKPMADGKTVISLKENIQTFILDVISKVSHLMYQELIKPSQMIPQIIFGTDFTKIKPSSIAVPPGYSNTFVYVIDKILEGVNKALNSAYPPWMQVCLNCIFPTSVCMCTVAANSQFVSQPFVYNADLKFSLLLVFSPTGSQRISGSCESF